MRIGLRKQRFVAVLLLVRAAGGAFGHEPGRPAPGGSYDRAFVARLRAWRATSQPTAPAAHEMAKLLEHGRYAAVVRRYQQARSRGQVTAVLHALAARAQFALGRLLGEPRVRELPRGQPGEFDGPWLLIEPRGRGRFLCAPSDSALYQVRAALDGGLDDAAVHLLHAQIWAALGREPVAVAILTAREPDLLALRSDALLAAAQRVAQQAGAVTLMLKLARRRARLDPQRDDAILAAAYVAAADVYAQAGEASLYVAMLERAAARRPDDPALRLRLADALWDAGRRDEAAKQYRAWLELHRGGVIPRRVRERVAR